MAEAHIDKAMFNLFPRREMKGQELGQLGMMVDDRHGNSQVTDEGRG